MNVRLRPHHLLCVLTYVGRGYGPAFVVGYDAIVARINAGEAVAVVDGPDDICAPLLAGSDPHCLRAGAAGRDARAARDLAAVLGRACGPGAVLTLDATTVARLRAAFASQALRAACEGCSWVDLCSTVAASGYRDVRLVPAR